MSIEETRGGVREIQEGNMGSGAGTPVYFAETHRLTPRTPDIILHLGHDKTGPVVAVAFFRLSLHMKLGLGDPDNDPNGVMWLQMERTSKLLTRSSFVFEHEGSSFTWERTRSGADGINGLAGKLSLANYRLTDNRSGNVVAVYAAADLKSLSVKGELNIFAPLSQDLEKLVVVSSAALSEKVARDTK
ncbi:hypothetical protein B0A52_03347 [Exophiala mesophila]|uniref:Uncharacterized protein n=1 Tax=Exophiala mesophila TaxID=212818 RepID=A0A438NB39_EXOME|nr:hypothetical protein B0A52_03347 [Exophiala mesophila]